MPNSAAKIISTLFAANFAKMAKGDTTDACNVGNYTFSYDIGAILTALPYEWWLCVFACMFLLGYCVLSTLKETWNKTWKKARKSW